MEYYDKYSPLRASVFSHNSHSRQEWAKLRLYGCHRGLMLLYSIPYWGVAPPKPPQAYKVARSALLPCCRLLCTTAVIHYLTFIMFSAFGRGFFAFGDSPNPFFFNFWRFWVLTPLFYLKKA